jgi:hypothetical protein
MRRIEVDMVFRAVKDALSGTKENRFESTTL